MSHSIDERLIAVPYIGNLRTGNVFIFMANPGLSPMEPFQEYAEDANDRSLEGIRGRRHEVVEALKRIPGKKKSHFRYLTFTRKLCFGSAPNEPG